MFNAAIFSKTLKDSAVTLALASFGMIAFVILIVYSMLNMGTEFLEIISKIGFVKRIFEVTLGIKVDGEVSINILFAVSFTHGMILMLSWGTLIATTTRVTVGEFERGTADLLLSLPVTRSAVYISTTAAWLVCAIVLTLCPFIGVAIGSQIFVTEEHVDLTRYIAPTANFFAINFAIASVACMFSCWMNRRTHSVGIIVGVAFVSVVLNFIDPFIESFQAIRYFGLLNYFRPVDIVRTGEWPIGSIVILLALGTICWLIGLIVYCRKDVPTA